MITETIEQDDVLHLYNNCEDWITDGITYDAVWCCGTKWEKCNINCNWDMVRNKEDNMKQTISKW